MDLLRKIEEIDNQSYLEELLNVAQRRKQEMEAKDEESLESIFSVFCDDDIAIESLDLVDELNPKYDGVYDLTLRDTRYRGVKVSLWVDIDFVLHHPVYLSFKCDYKSMLFSTDGEVGILGWDNDIQNDIFLKIDCNSPKKAEDVKKIVDDVLENLKVTLTHR